MTIIRTVSPTLSALTDKAVATEVAKSVAFVGLACRVARSRSAAGPVALTKAECAFLREYLASGADPLSAIREAEAHLSLAAERARTLDIATDAPRIDVPRVKAGQTSADGRALAIAVRKDMAPADKALALDARKEHATGAKALALLDLLAMIRVAWDHARASSIAFATVTGEKPAQPGKRLESHAAALLTADPAKVGALLKAMGIPEAAVGAILAVMQAKQPAPAAVPAIAG